MNGVKLNKEKGNFINVLDMQDGQIAEIVNWAVGTYIGTVVQRYEDSLITVGKYSRESWSNYFKRKSCHKDNKVRILEKGETITIL